MKKTLMNIIVVIGQLALLYAIFLAGNWFSEWSGIPVPGSVIGVVLLFALLMTGVIKVDWVTKGASLLLGYMPFFFLPIMVGAMQFMGLFTSHGLWLFLIAVISTWLVLAVSGIVSEQTIKQRERSS